MPPLLLATLGAFATARLTRLVTADQLTLPVRRAMLTRVREGGSLEYLLSCAWCVSVWIGTAVGALVAHLIHPGLDGTWVALWALLALSFSHVSGLLASVEVDA